VEIINVEMIGKISLKIYDDALISKDLQKEHIWQTEITSFIQTFEFKKHNPIFLDIGAHVGYFSLLVANLNPNIIVHSFEPSSNIYPLLQENTISFPNIIPHNYGIYERKKTKLFHSTFNTGDNSLKEKEIQRTTVSSGQPFDVTKYTCNDCYTKLINEFDIDFDRVELIKVDTQGTELDILLQLLSIPKPNFTVIMEHASDLYSYIENPEKFELQNPYPSYHYPILSKLDVELIPLKTLRNDHIFKLTERTKYDNY